MKSSKVDPNNLFAILGLAVDLGLWSSYAETKIESCTMTIPRQLNAIFNLRSNTIFQPYSMGQMNLGWG